MTPTHSIDKYKFGNHTIGVINAIELEQDLSRVLFEDSPTGNSITYLGIDPRTPNDEATVITIVGPTRLALTNTLIIYCFKGVIL